MTAVGVMFRREWDVKELTPFARKAEELGFGSVWVVEDCFYHAGVSQAAIALATTETIEVGLGIAPAVARNPAFTAMEFATLTNAFPGRFIGGIGHGVDVWMEQIGARPGSWITSMREIVTAVRDILAGERVTREGDYINLTDVELDRKPAEPLEILLGVRGPKSLQLAGEIASGVLLAEGSAPAYIEWAKDQMAIGAKRTETPGEQRLSVFTNSLINEQDPQAAIDVMRTQSQGQYEQQPQSPALTCLPYAKEIAARIAEGKQWDDDWALDMNVCGNAAQGKLSIDRMITAGAERVVLTPHPDDNPLEWLTTSAAVIQ